ncbi:dTDP-4-dehydrorhamnose reductase [Hyphomonas chukchiensis]|uniref:dTDP-4-dehydrorhamnose reductase n=1 Tax=Hyphomonas chukchiensis TaxID=1280947 RepID=UPI0030FB01ED
MTDIQTILVAGRSGQVAQALAATTLPAAVKLVALGRPDLDLLDPKSIALAMDRVSPDLVINAAAYTAVDQAESDDTNAFALNADGAAHLAKAAAERGAPILHLSTDYVFDGSKSGPYVETDPVAPLGVYGASKLAGERAVAAENPDHFILRTAWVYSAVGKNFVKTMLRLAETRDELGVVADQFGNPTSAADIAYGLIAIAQRLKSGPAGFVPGVYHMTASGEASWADFAEAIFATSAALGGPSSRVNRIASSEFSTPVKRPANSRLDCSRLSAAFGVTLPDWQGSTLACVAQLVETKGWNS